MNLKGGGLTMSNQTIKDMAKNYQPKTAKNITELKSIDVSLVMQTEEGIDSENTKYSFNFIEINGEKFRVPDSVLKDLKAILEKKPNLKTFAVTKTGEGRQTKYTTIPLD